jgi:hypothetical protein
MKRIVQHEEARKDNMTNLRLAKTRLKINFIVSVLQRFSLYRRASVCIRN